MEQKNEFRDKIKIAAKPETRVLPSNTEENESEGTKLLAIKKKVEVGDKNEEAAKPKAGFTPSN